MALVFVNYRKRDTQWPAGGLRRALVDRYGKAQIFFDDESVRAGDRYPEVIRDALGRADLLLAIIGPHWLPVRGPREEPVPCRDEDWVRQEIAVALGRRIPVVPVLIDGTPPGRPRLPVPTCLRTSPT